MRHLPLLIALAMPSLAPTLVSAAELSVRAVTLSSTGLSQIERSASLAPNEAATLRVPVGDVDDLLKSLVVRDPSGTVLGIRLPAQDLAEEAFRGLPLKPEDVESRTTLLAALRGQEVQAGGASGRLAEATETETGLRITLVTDTGLRSVMLREGDEVVLTDPVLAARVARAAAAMATAKGAAERPVEIALHGTARRDVSVLTVTSAPVWKPSWRLGLPAGKGEARLQGWAVVENTSGSDWKDIRLSLVAGEAAALRQALYAPIMVPRIDVPVRVAGQVQVTADTGARPAPPPPPAAAMMAPAIPAPLGRLRGAPIGQGAAEMAKIAEPALAEASTGRIAFTLPEPVTIRTGETANLPFIDAKLASERVWWVQDLSARNPLQAVSLTNATDHVLPDGLVTLYGTTGPESGNWLGDAELRAMPAGDTRLLAFGRDREVQVTRAASSTDRPSKIAFAPGKVLVEGIRSDEVSLAIDPKGAKGPLLVDLPRRAGSTPRFTVLSQGDYGLRTRIELDGTATTLRLPFEREMKQEIALWDAGLGDPMLLRWRDVEIEPSISRLPGGPGTLETLTSLLARTAAGTPGRDGLAAAVVELGEARKLLDAFRTQYRAYQSADASLDRARQAVEDRTGAERETARRALNRASLEAEQAGTRADTAWGAWQGAVQKLLARAG